MMKNQEQNTIFTQGKERVKLLESMKTFLKEGDYHHATLDINEFYDTLEDGSPEKMKLKEKFDILATWKNNLLKQIDTLMLQADAYQKHDYLEQKRRVKLQYNQERYLECHNILYQYKLYQDSTLKDYSHETETETGDV